MSKPLRRGCNVIELESFMQMNTSIKVVWSFMLVLALSFLPTTTFAQNEDPKVVATVNGEPITSKDVEYAAEDLLAQLAAVPGEHRYRFLVGYLVERKLIAQAAERAKIATTKEYERRASYYRSKALRDAYFKLKIEPRVSDDDAMAIYKAESAKIDPQDEVRARLIVVKTKAEADQLLDAIKKGAAFEEIAKARSLSQNAATGGDLGYFLKDKMVPTIAKVAFELKKGQVSNPFKSKAGKEDVWNLVKVEDRRPHKVQDFDAVKTRIRNVLLRQRVAETADKLRKAAQIEYVDPDAKPVPRPKATTQ